MGNMLESLQIFWRGGNELTVQSVDWFCLLYLWLLALCLVILYSSIVLKFSPFIARKFSPPDITFRF